MKNAKELTEACEKLLEMTLKMGADAAHISASSRFHDEVGLEKNDYHLSRSYDSVAVSLVVHKNQKQASAQSNDLSDEGLKSLTKRALTLASSTVEDDKLAFSNPGDLVDLTLLDQKLVALTSAEMLKIADEIFSPSFADPKLTIDGGKLSKTWAISSIVNSNGVNLTRESTMLATHLMGMAIEDGTVTSFDYDGYGSRTLSGFAEDARACFSDLGTELKSMLNPQTGESYKGPVIIRPEAVGKMLLDVIGFHAHGDSIKDGASRWADSIGKEVASSLLTLHDDPHDPDYLGCTPFDNLGTATNPATIIENGVLKFHMESVDSASRRGTKPTGHESGLTVPKLAGGECAVQDLAKLVDRPVLSMRRFSGNINNVTGDFSGVAKNSHLIKNGESIPLSETMVGGNVLEMLKSIVAIGKAQNYRRSLEVGPYLVDGISVSTGN